MPVKSSDANIVVGAMYELYIESVRGYAEKVFKSDIEPWLIENSLVFWTGSSTCYIQWTRKTPIDFVRKYMFHLTEENFIDIKKLGRICSILTLGVPGTSRNLGSLMPNKEVEE